MNKKLRQIKERPYMAGQKRSGGGVVKVYVKNL